MEVTMDPLWLFALLSLGIMVVPGMDMAFVLSSALVDGRRAGFAAVAGMVAGAVVHVSMGALGIGLLLQLVPAAFNALLAAGALYVGWIGSSLLRSQVALGAARLRDSLGGRPAAQARLGHAVGMLLLATAAWTLVHAWRSQ
ncbi:MAG: LysE family translocator, partial [Ramlibacter sp.]